VYESVSKVSAYNDSTSSGKMRRNDDVDRYVDSVGTGEERESEIVQCIATH
jgi:hypothetical protein